MTTVSCHRRDGRSKLLGSKLLGRRPLRSSPGVEAAWAVIREVVPRLDDDRILHRDITAVTALIRDGRLQRAVEAAIGPLAALSPLAPLAPVGGPKS